MKGFVEFIKKQGVVGLAIGFILGGAISKLVTSLVGDIINPIVGIFLGATSSLKDMYFQVGEVKLMWGSFLNNFFDFLIIATVVYSITKIFNLDKEKK